MGAEEAEVKGLAPDSQVISIFFILCIIIGYCSHNVEDIRTLKFAALTNSFEYI